eukprot:TRINITY_DN26563_c0_g1_i1.p1 TRINITY_DN26563_c0_g1~~TRINITY_DN26563_c0_g1_i1.p1  ORF type:complete len:1068 (-),score=192.45 TRINITY_DN26563_c0_g1_i1:255-3458(-)
MTAEHTQHLSLAPVPAASKATASLDVNAFQSRLPTAELLAPLRGALEQAMSGAESVSTEHSGVGRSAASVAWTPEVTDRFSMLSPPESPSMQQSGKQVGASSSSAPAPVSNVAPASTSSRESKAAEGDLFTPPADASEQADAAAKGVAATPHGNPAATGQTKPGPGTSAEEDLQLIKAKTMHEVVEDIVVEQHACKLLFLSNIQTDLLVKEPGSMQKLLAALNIPPPKLVINLLQSAFHGSSEKDVERKEPGRMKGRTPFFDVEEEHEALRRLDTFMADVLIPLAASTNAVVVMSALTKSCILAESFSKMFALARGKWGTQAPFSVLSMSSAVNRLYMNKDEHAHWMAIRDASRSWQARDAQLLQAAQDHHRDEEFHVDLDASSTYFILCDSLVTGKKSCAFDYAPFVRFRTELMRHLSMAVPTLALQTGYSQKDMQGAFSLKPAIAAVQAGRPVIFLDLRSRLVISRPEEGTTLGDEDGEQMRRTLSSLWPLGIYAEGEEMEADEMSTKNRKLDFRRGILKCAKASHDELCDKLLEEDIVKMECFDVCSIAYFKQALQGTLAAKEAGDDGDSDVEAPDPLHKAIQKARKELDDRATSDMEAEVIGVAKFLAKRYFTDAVTYAKRIESESMSAKEPICFEQIKATYTTWVQQLMSSPNLYSVNVSDLRSAKKLLYQTVKLDRLPKKTSLEGLMLLQQAWCQHDVAVYLATRYKILAKALYAFHLLCGCIVVFASSQAAAISPIGEQLVPYYPHIAFATTLLLVAITTLESYYNAKARWRSLRSSASRISAMIWLYRTRVGVFDSRQCPVGGDGPERRLYKQLNNWIGELVSSAELDRTSMMQAFAPSVYKHCQYRGNLPNVMFVDLDGSPCSPNPRAPQQERTTSLQQLLKRGSGTAASESGSPQRRGASNKQAGVVDDMHSPVTPVHYIRLRVLPMLRFYQERIPSYERQQSISQVVVIALTFSTALLVNYNFLGEAVAVSVIGTTATAWMEFADVRSKLQRYNRVVKSMTEHLNWWRNLTDVEKASPPNIKSLVEGAETILENECSGWFASGPRPESGGEKQDTE